ncbi:hypothetical protein A2865_00675 [Candidatus Woesebacteria bacterium RIFCSPHIGHO2_01_FULL_39_17]|uniref:Uncharacterized protein n=3 Tax=Candidatus Woeseibacteriota TaxID=1752722 RepID=A0A0G0ND96_9BACT|nr:MAG: hypothetical protein US72_C0013G0018 [Microgenomates group bacterium GW2011_GWC1_38_12]KKQ93430.1 MAG: hypothetical protein UT19_C0012G0019 [Candidatus Woesebacteria bacterium GW2011_GWB1_39_10b]KKR13478.1 MAG: hypothetical protein UT40_C0016G0009 [Candidatus Woesebacteria bacterium GW2011_GWA1_39_21b]OGM22915.1 MAG: hypothetical protein A2865_00675 [Candidatus Woesebacteria bacterium RIFCSPHIGHO2_01_FULL_39_17]OGM65387.1 MAG: hypothetical protein A3A52_00560 [Candidatus Woesebacteria b
MAKVRLSKSASKVLSSVFVSFSEVFLASLIIPVFISRVEIARIPVLILGVLLTIASVFLSIKFGERAKI